MHAVCQTVSMIMLYRCDLQYFTFQCCIHTPNLSHCGFCYLYFRNELVATRNQVLFVRSFWSFRCLIHSFPKLSSLKLHEEEAALTKDLLEVNLYQTTEIDDSYGMSSSAYVFTMKCFKLVGTFENCDSYKYNQR